MNIPFEQSPNYWDSNNTGRIKAIVYHHTAGGFEGSKSWLKNPKAQASAHYIIRKDGYIVQLVKDEDSAWHCGISFANTPKDRVGQIIRDNWGTNPNLYTIGIEIEGSGEPFTDAQYNTLAELSRELCSKYKIPVDRYHLIGHYEISPTGKPTDPKEMDWNRLILSITGQPMPTFNFELYLKDNNLFMRVLSGSINGKATVKNLTKGTSWEVNCVKSVGNDGNAINFGMEPCLYEVVALGVVRQFDNRPVTPPADPCANVKAELETAKKTITERDATIVSLQKQVADLTTQVNSFVPETIYRKK